ncbi:MULTISPECIES: NADH-quinone oxidoreductase subunit NuoG [unclassified Sphingomonas]|uniref:NADH-quinone oxidoreductase subunit NuoG n=1 Tax=unclassified Sphingomonas TaxID=196159 RepID=UPI000BCC524A|nr:MAG: NADH-quinone oxidoreductase subunit G [Sphingomonas sp. 12-62-6]OYX37314.1 MAG: NADH-quinone oxidoreductase subunit G [Sphingomonas sp. 32-62-10]OYY67138.1 MAG: NADH-quinone oxidoreductase subunit G [Sphingomonas sp. 28-62-11]
MPKLKIDGIEIEVPQGATVLQACELAGKEIPRFCYHERLSIAGNCRMCLVEVKPGPPKPQASCALPAAENQEIFTNSPMVKNAREGVMEFLLINHPLDCPICDQGGECDLQDQSVAYGRGSSRYDENKRAVTEKYMGPIVKTVMTRCIQCTRCVRFAEEVAGVEEIGAIGRGENMQITSYLEHAVTSELSGNVVDLCPVGALTSKPYAFEARPWELKKTLTIDVMDAVGTNIRLDSRGRQVLRCLPRINEDVNEEWATDKTRHAIDGLVRKRLDRPFVRKDGKLVEASWDEAFAAIAAVKAGKSVAAIAGDLIDCETMFAAKALLAKMGSSLLEGRQTGMAYDVTSLAAVNFNTTIAGVERADAILLVGTNLRWEAPLVNTRVRKAIKKGAKVFAIGPETDLTYKVEWLGNGLSAMGKLPEAAAEAFKNAQRPMIIVGGAALKSGHGAALAFAKQHNLVRTLEDGTAWNGFNVVHMAAARMGGLMLGYAQPGGIADIAAAKPKLVFFLGADEVDFWDFAKSFKVYIGHHGDKGAAHADVVLPGASYAEKSGTWMNLEGRVQRGEQAVFPPGDAREDWTILRALSAVMGHTLPFDTIDQLRADMAKAVPELGQLGLVTFDWAPAALDAKGEGEIGYPIKDFYLTNAICRASPTMQRCSAELVHGQSFAEAAE